MHGVSIPNLVFGVFVSRRIRKDAIPKLENELLRSKKRVFLYDGHELNILLKEGNVQVNLFY